MLNNLHVDIDPNKNKYDLFLKMFTTKKSRQQTSNDGKLVETGNVVDLSFVSDKNVFVRVGGRTHVAAEAQVRVPGNVVPLEVSRLPEYLMARGASLASMLQTHHPQFCNRQDTHKCVSVLSTLPICLQDECYIPTLTVKLSTQFK